MMDIPAASSTVDNGEYPYKSGGGQRDCDNSDDCMVLEAPLHDHTHSVKGSPLGFGTFLLVVLSNGWRGAVLLLSHSKANIFV